MPSDWENADAAIRNFDWRGVGEDLYVPLPSLGLFKGYRSIQSGMAPQPVLDAWLADVQQPEDAVPVKREKVNLHDVYAGQRVIIKSKLRKFIRAGEAAFKGGSLPRVYRYQGQDYMGDGHHRAVLQGVVLGPEIEVAVREV